MAKRGGFPGGMGMPGNMNNLMKQAQKMQKQMEPEGSGREGVHCGSRRRSSRGQDDR